MDFPMRIFAISCSFITLLIGASGLAYAQDKAAIEQKLTGEYALTQPTADLTDIVTAGAILVLKKGNVMMAPISSTNFYQNTYKDGKISQNAAGKVTNALGRFSRLPGASAPSAPATRTYVPGEKMWVTKIECKPDGVTFDLYTDAVADVRYKASLKFEFPKGIALTVDQVDKLVGEVFKVQPADDAAPATGAAPPAAAAAPAPRGQPAPAPAPIEAPPPPIEAPPPPIEAPPPPPADPKTVKLGETKDAVIADFGQPKTIAKTSATKEIYVYPDFKITFTNGKVTDIQ
jgi:hypothetical protein